MPEHQRTVLDELSLVKPQCHGLGGECQTTHTKAPAALDHKHGTGEEPGPKLLHEHNTTKEKQQPGSRGLAIILQRFTLIHPSGMTLA